MTQQTEVGSNPVQVETGEFDEAIEVVEDVASDSTYALEKRLPLFGEPSTKCFKICNSVKFCFLTDVKKGQEIT